jgi:hypothetical protein
MGSIVPFLPDGMRLRDSVFEPHQIKAMSAAFNEVCEALKLDDDSSAKKVMAGRRRRSSSRRPRACPTERRHRNNRVLVLDALKERSEVGHLRRRAHADLVDDFTACLFKSGLERECAVLSRRKVGNADCRGLAAEIVGSVRPHWIGWLPHTEREPNDIGRQVRDPGGPLVQESVAGYNSKPSSR